MKYIVLIISILALSACGSGSDGEVTDIKDSPSGTSFTLQNIRFDAKDYYEGEQVTVTKGTSFEVQWVSPTSASYRIDIYLLVNGQKHTDTNKIAGLKCGNNTFSLCPNATGEVQCKINNNSLSCFIGGDFVGSEDFQDKDLSNLRLSIRGCDALSKCDVKTFNLSVQKSKDD
jgi:hypothetical protein